MTGLGSISVGAHRAPAAYVPPAITGTRPGPALFADADQARALLRTLPTETLRSLAAWCTEEADSRPA